MHLRILAVSLLCTLTWITVGQAAPTASRTSGVAPLAVHFDADVSASSGSSMPFHDYEYSWNFGDINSGTWGPSGKSKNVDKGPVASHVYEASGTYTATLTVKNPNTGATISTSSFEITVSDPDTVFSGTNTTCISTTSDFTGCPSGAAQVTTSSLSGLSGYTDAGERVLLKRGDSWTVSSNISFPDNSGPVHIGAFGSCSSPDSLGICSNAPQVTMGSSIIFLGTNFKSDWRLTDISFPNTTSAGAVFGGGQNPRNMLAYRISTTGSSSPVNFTSWRNNDSEYIDGLFLVSSRITDSNSMTIWIGGERIVLMGNIVGNSSTSHVVRIWNSYKGVVAHNTVYGAASGEHALKFHGASVQGTEGQSFVGTFAETGNTGLRHLSEFNVVSNNIFGGNFPWIVSIAPQNAVYDERVQDLIFEKNKVLFDYEDKGIADTGVGVSGQYITVRNNIIDATGGNGDGLIGIDAYRRGIEFGSSLLQGIRIYNNTIYSQTNHTWSNAVRVKNTVTGAIVRNNLGSMRNTTLFSVFSDAGVSTIESNNLDIDIPSMVDPDNATSLSRNFALTASSVAAIDHGYEIPNRDDYIGNCRQGLTYDVGAYEYGASPCQAGYAQVGSGSGRFSTGGTGSFQQ